MRNIMLDLETMGNRPTSAIISVGAVYFEEDGLGEEFYQRVSLESSMAAGLTVDASTILWWMQQSEKARAEFINNDRELPLSAILDFFTSFVKPGTLIWGNGADFDNVVLANAYRVLGRKLPWSFRDNRCYRTMKNYYHMAPTPEVNDLAHNALADAKWQARHLIMIGKWVVPQV